MKEPSQSERMGTLPRWWMRLSRRVGAAPWMDSCEAEAHELARKYLIRARRDFGPQVSAPPVELSRSAGV